MKVIQDELSWCMLFADDITLITKTRDGVNNKLERSRHTVKSVDFRLSILNTKRLHCGFTGGKRREKSHHRWAGMTIPKVEKFEN